MLFPTLDFFEWDCKSLLAEEEIGAPMESEWATREGNDMFREPVPLNYLLPCQPCASYWVLHRVKEIQHCLWIECMGF